MMANRLALSRGIKRTVLTVIAGGLFSHVAAKAATKDDSENNPGAPILPNTAQIVSVSPNVFEVPDSTTIVPAIDGFANAPDNLVQDPPQGGNMPKNPEHLDRIIEAVPDFSDRDALIKVIRESDIPEKVTVQFGTAIVRDFNKFIIDGKTSKNILNGYNFAKRSIEMYICVPHPDAKPEIRSFCDALNKEVKFAFTHEVGHANEHKLDFSGLSFDQIMQIPVHLELAKRWQESLHRVMVFLNTGKFADAFPLQYERVMREAKIDFDAADTNPFLHYKFSQKNIDNKELMTYLFENRNEIDSFGASGYAALFKTITRSFIHEYPFYAANQFIGTGLHVFRNSYGTLSQDYVGIQDGQIQPQSKSVDFDRLVREIYTDENGVCILDFVTGKDHDAFIWLVQYFYNQSESKQMRRAFEQKIKSYVKKYEEMRVAVLAEKTPGKYDMQVNKRVFSEDDIKLMNVYLGQQK